MHSVQCILYSASCTVVAVREVSHFEKSYHKCHKLIMKCVIPVIFVISVISVIFMISVIVYIYIYVIIYIYIYIFIGGPFQCTRYHIMYIFIGVRAGRCEILLKDSQ